MPRFLKILEFVSKNNKYFTVKSSASDKPVATNQTRSANETNNTFVAWRVGSLTEMAFEKGKRNDYLVDKLTNISTEMDNIHQATQLIEDTYRRLQNKWKSLTKLSSRLDVTNRKLTLEIPCAHQWLNDVQLKRITNADEIYKLARALNVPEIDIATSVNNYTFALINDIARELYKKHFKDGSPLQNVNLLNKALTPDSRLNTALRETVTTLSNTGSFASKIDTVANHFDHYKSQADELIKMISVYDNNIPTLEALIYGCNNDRTKLKSITDMLNTSPSDSSFNDIKSQSLLQDGLENILSNYNICIKAWLADIEQIYQAIQNVISEANNYMPIVTEDFLTTMTTRYSEFKQQLEIINRVNTDSEERLTSSNKLLNIFNQTVASTTDQLIEQYKVSLINTNVQNFLINNAKNIVAYKSRLEEFTTDKISYVKNLGFLSNLNFVYPERSIFRNTDHYINISDIAVYLDMYIKNSLHTHKNTQRLTGSIMGNHDCQRYEQRENSDWYYITDMTGQQH